MSPRLADTLVSQPRPMAAERRRAPRVQIDATVTMWSEANFFTGFSADISAGGLFVAMFDAMPALGEEVDLRFTVPSGRQVNVRARVQWLRESRSGNADVLPGVGLQFLNLRPEDQVIIEGFVASREPLFFVD